MYMTYMAGAKSASVGGVLHSSTPIFSRSNLTPSKSYDQSSFNVSGKKSHEPRLWNTRFRIITLTTIELYIYEH
jgi:hypothetical protein